MGKDIIEGIKPTFLQEDAQRKARWAHLTEGLDDYRRLTLETLLDNTKAWMLSEEATTLNVGPFTTYAFPLLRRVFPEMISQEIVSVQPINQPTGMVFYLDFMYGTAKGDVQAGTSLYERLAHYYAGGAVRGEPVGTGTGASASYNLDFFPIMIDSEAIYVDSVKQAKTDYTINYDTGQLTINAPANAVITADYTVRPGEGEEIPEIDLNLTSSPVVAESKKLRSSWTIESQQDLMAYHGLDIESELLSVQGDEIRREIDHIIIMDVYQNAKAGNVNWSKTKPTEFSGTTKEYEATILDAIADANNLIRKKRYANANWIVCDSDVATRFEKLAVFRVLDDTLKQVTTQGIFRYGILNGRYTVYVDPNFPQDTMLVGYKGGSWLETGYVYAPYIPIYTTPVFVDPKNMKSQRAIMSRYARKMTVPEYYATVTLTA